jgi:hypothetical protein
MKNSIMLIALTMLVSCGFYTQTTSGKEYLKKHNSTNASPEQGDKNFDQELIKAANVEPSLTFPARIGLARIDGGQLSAVPGDEIELWMKTAENLGTDFGEFVPLSPLVASAVNSEVAAIDRVDSVMQKIRLGAARQHMDAVLIYEAYSSVDETSNILSIANLTIIGGYLLPSKQLTTEGYGNAMLIDVLSGYPYGTINTSVPKNETTASAWGWGSDKHEAADKIKLQVTRNLTIEAEAMFKKLRTELHGTGQ